MHSYSIERIYNVFIMYIYVHAVKRQVTTSLNMKGNIKVLLSDYAAMQYIESTGYLGCLQVCISVYKHASLFTCRYKCICHRGQVLKLPQI